MTVVLPDGVTAKSATIPPQTDAGVVTATGAAAGSYSIGNYTPATSTVKGTVHIEVTNTLGFGTGEYSTVNLDIVSANTPTAGGFSLTNFIAKDVDGVAITPTPGFTASIQ